MRDTNHIYYYYILLLRADEAKGSIQWKMTLQPRLCVKTADKSYCDVLVAAEGLYQEKTPQMKTLRQQQLCVKNKKSSTCLNNIWNLLHAYLNKRDLHHRHHRNPSQSIRKTKTQELMLSGLQFSYCETETNFFCLFRFVCLFVCFQ